MAEETENIETTDTAETPEAPEANEQKIMCFVSKKMVPISQTIEIEYMPHKKVRVLPRYVRYEDAQ